MEKRIVAPYGSWKSPVAAHIVAAHSIRLSEPRLYADHAYWTEMRPGESGRTVVVRKGAGGSPETMTPPGFSARTRAHEYGGGSYLVHEDTVYFANDADQRVYRHDSGGPPEPITPVAKLRFADGVFDVARHRIVCVREDHSNPSIGPVNGIVGLDPIGMHVDQGGQILVVGNDFYSSPRLSVDGAQLAWLTWNRPNMPWDGTELWVGQLDSAGRVSSRQLVAGGPRESVFQPEWSPDGHLYFVSDRSGWWNLYRWRGQRPEPMAEMEAEFGRPQWVFGMRTYAFASARTIICCYARGGTWNLAKLDLASGQLRDIPTPYTEILGLDANAGHALLIVGGPLLSPAVVLLDLATGDSEVLRAPAVSEVDPGYLSTPRAIEFPTENGRTAHGFFYEPRNAAYTAPGAERPPLIVISHGGPTGATSSALRMSTQFWTSRGFAVLDVNYGGSTGYGRAYRNRLKGRWGIVDVDDCVNGARYLASQCLVDGSKLIIRGGSAGGYTTLSALAFRDVFCAGGCYYGVSDLTALAEETHKFESRYLDQMVGPYPEQRATYLARSPLYSAERISCPVIFFQGLEDRVVPPNQAEMMADALRARGIPVAYLPFAGEQHGFRRAENIVRSLEAELYFYATVLGFELPEPIEPVEIANLGAGGDG